jgi:tetratricopeptide (TPR) repeat protein/CRISPR/Cas system-associated endoribonuclease Cas2
LQQKPTAHQAAQLVAALSRAVHYAHEHGVVHRDIKPANVLIDDETGQPILTDFGLAKDATDSDVQLTLSGQVMGTPAYMAPEQAAGRQDQIGPATDVYSLGAVLYELITGRRPFTGTVGEVISLVQSEPPPPPRKIVPKLHRDLETICLKAMAKEPALRYVSAADFAEDLERFCAGESILARRERLSRAVLRKLQRNPVVAVALVLLLAALTVVAFAAWRIQQNRQLNQLTQQLETELEGTRWSPGEQQRLEELLQKIARFDASAAEAARARALRRHAQFIQQSIQQASLEPQDVLAIQSAIDQLAQHDESAVKSLREALATRLRTWSDVFQLAAPFDTLRQVFPYDDISAGQDQLVRKKPSESPTWLYDWLPTRIPSPGMVEIEVEFAAESWPRARWLGVGLNVEGERGYYLVLSPSAALNDDVPPGITPVFSTFAETQTSAGEGVFQLLLIRNRQTVRVDTVRIPPGPLRLNLRREVDRLTWQVNDASASVFRDIFPLAGEQPGVFGVVWPADIGLRRLNAAQQTMQQLPSAIERGDFLFDNGRYDEALPRYRRQMALAESPAIRQEAQLKVGLCLLRLKRTDQALTELEAVAAAPGDRFPLVASAHLWLAYLQQGRADLADVVFDSMAVKHRLEDLTQFVPSDLREEIYGYYLDQTSSASLLQHRPKIVQQLRRAVAVADAVMPYASIDARRGLMRAYHAAGDLTAGMQVAQELIDQQLADVASLSDHTTSSTFALWALLDEYGWMACQQQSVGDAQQVIQRAIGALAGSAPDSTRPLLVERARLHAHAGDWKAAERDLEEFLRVTAPGDVPYRFYAGACLLRGFLYERAGDPTAAQSAWKQGLFRTWPQQPGDSPGAEQRFAGGGFYGELNNLMLASLTNEMNDQEAERVMSQMVQQAATASWGGIFQHAVTLPPAAIREMFQGARGHDFARRFALHQVSHADHMRELAGCLGISVLRHSAFGGTWSDDEEQIVWDMMQVLYQDFVTEGRLTTAHLLQLAMSWKGVTNALGWAGVAPSLEPHLRGPFAYVLGHRFRRLGQPEQARQMFLTAVADAPPDSTLARLAERALAP